MGFQFDPDDPAFIDDPYPIYKILRDEHPVYRHEATGFYVITRNRDVERILGDYATFSSSRGNAIVIRLFGSAKRLVRSILRVMMSCAA